MIRLIEANADLIARRAGRPIVITTVSARNRDKDRGFVTSFFDKPADTFAAIRGERVELPDVALPPGAAAELLSGQFDADPATVEGRKRLSSVLFS